MTGNDAARHRVSVRPARSRTAARSSDAELTEALVAAQAGDEAAFTHVYRAVHPRLQRYLTALVGSEAEDIAAETWIHAVQGLDRFRGDIDGFRGWVATIARHRAIDHLRATARRPFAAATEEALSNRAAEADTETSAMEQISTRRALALIAALPPDQAEAVLLRAVMGLGAARAGEVLGKAPGAVRMAAHRGLRTLALRLAATTESRRSDVFALAAGEELR